jgi:hypothetical protein
MLLRKKLISRRQKAEGRRQEAGGSYDPFG